VIRLSLFMVVLRQDVPGEMTRAASPYPGYTIGARGGPSGATGRNAVVETRGGRTYVGRGGEVDIDPTQTTVTRLLADLRDGDDAALEQLFALLYDELHRLARRHRRRWQGDYTLDTTALVHEAYLKLAGGSRTAVESRAHFAAVAATAMRHILCNYARDRRTQKRGGAITAVTLDEAGAPADERAFSREQSDTLLALDDALRRLEQVDPRRSRVVECRFFGGLTVEETAAAIGASPRTVKRDWAVAQAWLHRELESRS
jgi:RNA polymerase sigma factor (TIGR02999 family)